MICQMYRPWKWNSLRPKRLNIFDTIQSIGERQPFSKTVLWFWDVLGGMKQEIVKSVRKSVPGNLKKVG